MPSKKIELVITGDSRGLERAFGKAGLAGNKFSGSIAGWAKGALVFGAVGKAADLLGGAVHGAVAELAEAAKVSAQTQAVLKSTGGVAGVAAADVDKLATALMRKSGVDDEAIKSGENLLLTFTKIRNVGDDRIFDEATKSALDMSVALGKDMTQAATLVGKALNDPIAGLTALRRVGVQFTESQRDQIKALVESGRVMDAQKLILRELQTEFGGSAEAAGKTLPGRLNILKESFKNLTADAITPLIPIFEKLVGWLQRQVDAWTESGKAQEFFKRAAEKAAEIAKGAGEAVRDAWPHIKKMAEWADTVAEKLGGWDNVFKLLIGGAVLGRVSRLAGGFGNKGLAGSIAGATLGLTGPGGLVAALRALPAPASIPLFAALGSYLGITAATGPYGKGGPFAGLSREQNPAFWDATHGIGAPGFPGTGSAPAGNGVMVPSSFSSTHDTAGLSGFPAVDIAFNSGGGVTILSPNEETVVVRLSGKSPSLGGKSGGAYGYSVYLASATGTYFITHLATVSVKPGQRLAPGTPIGTTANAAVAGMSPSASHAHVGKSSVSVPVGGSSVTPTSAATAPTSGLSPKVVGAKAGITDLPSSLRTQLALAERTKGPAGLRAQLAAQRSILGVYTNRLKGASPEDRADLEEARTAVLGTIDRLSAEIAAKERAAVEKLEAQIDQGIKRIQDKQRAAVDRAREQILGQRESVASAFGTVLESALRVFDAKTQELLARARANVAKFGFEIGAGELTPGEKALGDFDKAQAAEAKRLARERANAIQDEAERAAAIRELDLADQREALAERARLEREAADEALKDEVKRLEEERKTKRTQFEVAYAELLGRIQSGKLTAAQGQEQLVELLKTYDVGFAEAGDLLGKSFATMFNAQMDTAIGKVDTLIARIMELRKLEATLPAGGGYVPPTHVGGGVDSRALGGPVIAGRAYWVGEEGPELVVPRSSGSVLTAGASRALSGGDVHVHVHADTIVGTNLDRAAEELAVPLVDALRKQRTIRGPLRLD